MCAYHSVPPVLVENTKVSTLFAFVVSVGRVPPDHLVPVGQVIDLTFPSQHNCNVNEYI